VIAKYPEREGINVQYHEVKLYFTLASQVNGINVTGAGVAATTTSPTMSVWVDYIFLDTQERTRFAQLPHEYLIEQLQFTGSETAVPSQTSQASQNIRLNNLGRKSITPFTSGHCGWESRLDFQAPAMVQVFC
jgi:hypothetical protein